MRELTEKVVGRKAAFSPADTIKEIYDTQEKQEYLERITKMEVLDLINTLGLNDINIKVNIK